jgi:hypothetical protein
MRQTKKLRVFDCGSCPNSLKQDGKTFCGWRDGDPEVDGRTIDKNCPLQDWDEKE